MDKTGLARIIFITGTDTGVGKTLLTALLLRHLRQGGCRALALKPFCSGSRADTNLLYAIQDGELRPEEITPCFFPEPLAPLAAGRQQQSLTKAVEHVLRAAKRCQCLLVEGIGGLLVPLGKGFTVRDWIARLRCETIIVARNRLGTLNHTLLTAEVLRAAGRRNFKVVLMSHKKIYQSSASNGRVLARLLAPTPQFELPDLGRKPLRVGAVRRSEKKLKKTLARILA
jgi:dethiobiotin synthetase